MPHEGLVFVVDDDPGIRHSIRVLLESRFFRVLDYGSASAFLAQYIHGVPGCLITDLRMHGIDGLLFQKRLKEKINLLPVIFLTAFGTVDTAVQAMRGGAVDFIEKPFDEARLIQSVHRALELARLNSHKDAEMRVIGARMLELSEREQKVLQLLVSGFSNKEIASRLGLSPRTVEIHRANLKRKLGIHDFASLIRVAVEAGIPRIEEAGMEALQQSRALR